MINGTLTNMNESKNVPVAPKNTLSEDLMDIMSLQREIDMVLKDTLAIMLGNQVTAFETKEPACHLDAIAQIKLMAQNNVQLAIELKQVIQ